MSPKPTYPKSSEAFGPLGPCTLTHLFLEPTHEVPECFGAWNNIERGRNSGPLLKVTHPQLCSCKLPLNICMVLQPGLSTFKKKKHVLGECFNIFHLRLR